MDSLGRYDRDETLSDDPGHAREPLGTKEVRAVYMVTYSQANLDLFLSHEDFALAVIRLVSNGTAKLLQWCCSCEKQKVWRA